MAKIRIKNFGPIKAGCQSNDGWIDIKKVTLFIGNQGTGKSTIAKLISTFTWIEKALTRGDFDKGYFESKDRIKTYLDYHGISEYLPEYSSLANRYRASNMPVIGYHGSSYSIEYTQHHLLIEEFPNPQYSLPQIMYVPSERNFISTIDDPKSVRLASEPLVELLTEIEQAKKAIKKAIILPINKVGLTYDKEQDVLYINGTDYKINLNRASSGFQSVVPLYLVSWYLADQVKGNNGRESMSSDELSRFKTAVREIWANPDLNEEQRRVALSAVSFRFRKTAFINIVEEPEQNLFPQSQWSILKSLLQMNSFSNDNKLIMTSHSPYIINFLTLCVKAGMLFEKLGDNIDNQTYGKIAEIVPLDASLKPDNIVIYELDDNGNITKLDDYNGLPNDDNYLNNILEFSNQEFSKLLDIEINAGKLF